MDAARTLAQQFSSPPAGTVMLTVAPSLGLGRMGLLRDSETERERERETKRVIESERNQKPETLNPKP